MPKTIPPQIGNDETLVRGIVHPLMFSKSRQKLKANAFLPPPGRSDVSVLRAKFTTPDFCKKHFKTLVVGNHQYCGMAILEVSAIHQINESLLSEHHEAKLNVVFRDEEINNLPTWLVLVSV